MNTQVRESANTESQSFLATIDDALGAMERTVDGVLDALIGDLGGSQTITHTLRRCPQCWKYKDHPSAFIGARGVAIGTCTACRDRYGGWDRKTTKEKQADRKAFPVLGDSRVLFVVRSGNRKLGGIPSSITERGSCPPTCGFYGAGCYAEYSVLGHHWRSTPVRGESWGSFCQEIEALPEGQLWRHNTAGDLPGPKTRVDHEKLSRLVVANAGKRGFTFTHKPVLRGSHEDAKRNRDAIGRANRNGFTINLSADGVDQADALWSLAIGPVAVVLPSSTPDRSFKTPNGHPVVICPAELSERVTCATCALCAKVDRHSIVGFRAHGQSKREVSELVQLRMKRAKDRP